MTATTESPATTSLPSELKVELWKKVEHRLRQGEVIITNEQFYKVMERDFGRLVNVKPDRPTKLALINMIMAVNDGHPETYLTLGIKNAVTAFFKESEKRTAGQEGGAEEARAMIKEMIREGRTALFLEGIGVPITGSKVSPVIEAAILKIVDGKKLKAAPRREKRQRQKRSTSSMVSVNTTAASAASENGAERPAVEGLPDEKEQSQRITEERERTEELTNEEVERAPRNLESYLQQNLLSEDEVTDLRTLYSINQRLADGEIDEEEANRLRAEIEETVREKLQQRVREAVDHSVHYVNSFEALKRLPKERDDALKFLIEHKTRVSSTDEDVALGMVTEALEDDDELVENLGVLMERKDHEARMIAANMPPYRHIYASEKLGTFTVEESFVDDLREIDRDELSARLNSEDTEVRVRAAADLKCMVALIDLLMKESPFQREVQCMRIILRMKKIYNGGVDEKDGRNKVMQFLRRRLLNLYPNLSREDKAAVEEAGTAICEGRAVETEQADERGKRVYRA